MSCHWSFLVTVRQISDRPRVLNSSYQGEVNMKYVVTISHFQSTLIAIYQVYDMPDVIQTA